MSELEVTPMEEEAITEGTADAPVSDESTQAPDLDAGSPTDAPADAPSSDTEETPEAMPATESEAPAAESASASVEFA